MMVKDVEESGDRGHSICKENVHWFEDGYGVGALEKSVDRSIC
jgi:hypothetical protein